MANDNMKHRRLQELDESDFDIVEGEPDIRGWDVKNDAGKTIGEVDELILDAKERKIRYMIVDLDHDVVKAEHDDKVLIPIGLAELDEKDDDVLIPGISIEQLQQLPAYDRDGLDEQTEQRIRSVFGSTGTAAGTDFYSHEHFNEDRLYTRRLIPEHTTAERKGIQLDQRQS